MSISQLPHLWSYVDRNLDDAPGVQYSCPLLRDLFQSVTVCTCRPGIVALAEKDSQTIGHCKLHVVGPYVCPPLFQLLLYMLLRFQHV
jgi:hypothetical protein